MTKYYAVIMAVLALLLPNVCAAQMDKALHTSVGFGITITVSSATNRPKLGFVAGVGAGLAKELWDSKQRGHQASASDFLATLGGSAGAYALWKLVLNRKPPVKIAAVDRVEDSSPQPNAASVPATTHTRAPDPASMPAMEHPSDGGTDQH